jgi:reactive intermediate/imine deaminase
MTKEVIGEPFIIEGTRLPFSKAIRAGDFVFASGQVPLRGGALVTGPIEDQTRAAMENVKDVLAEAGCSLDDVVKSTVWLTDAADFAAFNAAYAEYFQDDPPARSTVESKLMVDVKVEIEVIAYKPR